MRTSTANEFKNRRGARTQPTPRAGSHLRSIYDLFMSSKGCVIDFSCPHAGGGRWAADLSDYYGLDIRRVSRKKWVLAGEWFGKVYVDYIAEHLASLKNREAA